MLATLPGLMFKVFFLVAIAYLLYRRGVLTQKDQASITTVLMNIVVYFTVLMSSQQEFSLAAARAIALTGVYAILFYAAGIPLLTQLAKRLALDSSQRKVFVSSIIFCNITFMGYPILQELYGNVGLLCAITYSMIYNVLFYTWGMANLGQSSGGKLRSILTNKIAIVSVVALLMYFLQIRIPEPFLSTFSMVGGMTMPLSMLIIGCNLAQSGVLHVLRERSLYLPTLLRLVVAPAAVYLSMRLLGLDPLLIRISTIIAALPAGAMTAIVANQSECAPTYAANIMVQTMLAMTVTLPMWVFLVGL